jgi:hypothetical protein
LNGSESSQRKIFGHEQPLFPTRVEVDAQRPFAGNPLYATGIPWQHAAPAVHLFADGSSNTRPFYVLGGGTAPLSMGSGNTPVAAFSNAPTSAAPSSGTTATQFALFLRGDFVACSRDADCGPYSCDLNLFTRTVIFIPADHGFRLRAGRDQRRPGDETGSGDGEKATSAAYGIRGHASELGARSAERSGRAAVSAARPPSAARQRMAM